MKKKLIFTISLFTIVFFACKNEQKNNTEELKKETSIRVEAAGDINLEIVNFEEFESYLKKDDNTVYVINFWATWCAPCVKELPYFEEINQNYIDNNVKVLLVSLDFPHVYEKKLKPFILKNKLKSKVIALDDVDANSWIPKVNEKWAGSIPATIIYKNNKSKFFERSFSYEELEHEVKEFLN